MYNILYNIVFGKSHYALCGVKSYYVSWYAFEDLSNVTTEPSQPLTNNCK